MILYHSEVPMKPCIECHGRQPLDAFYRHPRTIDGRMGVCMDCHRERMRVLRLTNPKVQERERLRARQPERKAFARINVVRWRQKHPEAYRAHTAVSNALRDGRLFKSPCAVCASNENIHGHHKDYSKPLSVTWLCAKCHHRLHAAFPEFGGH